MSNFFHSRLHRNIRQRRSKRMLKKIINIRNDIVIFIVRGGDVTITEVSVVGIRGIDNLPRIGIGVGEVNVD
ncbi:hypothetical protein Hanom_Chr05g00470201 [Helianthus anomalus]